MPLHVAAHEADRLGLHLDEASRLAAFVIEIDEYSALGTRTDLKVIPGMGNRKSSRP